MALYDTSRMAAALGALPTRPSSAAGGYGLARPPSRSAISYSYGASAYPSRTARSPSPAPFAFRPPSPARSSSVVHGLSFRSSTPTPLYVPTTTPARAASPVGGRNGAGVGGKGLAGSRAPQSFYPSPTEPTQAAPSLSYPCSGAGPPSTTSLTSSFLRIAPHLDDIPPTVTLALSQLGNSLETLATDFPASSSIVQHNPPFANAFSSWIKLLLPIYSSFTAVLSQLRNIAEAVWRAAGGFIAASTPRPVTVDVENADPEGGTHTTTAAERLAPLSPAAMAQAVAQMQQTTAGFGEVGQGVEQLSQRVSVEAEEFVALSVPMEQMRSQALSRFPGGAIPHVPGRQLVETLLRAISQLVNQARNLYNLLARLSSDPSVSSGIWYHPSQARDVFRSYRRIDFTLSANLTQISHAYAFTLDKIRTAGYLPSTSTSYGNKSEQLATRRSSTFPSLQPEKAFPPAYYRPSSASGTRSSSPSVYAFGCGAGGVPQQQINGGLGVSTRSRSRTR